MEISSEEQLDGDDIKLAVVTVEDVATPLDGIALPGLVGSIRSAQGWCGPDGVQPADSHDCSLTLMIRGIQSMRMRFARRFKSLMSSERFPALSAPQLRRSYRAAQPTGSTFEHRPSEYVISTMNYSTGMNSTVDSQQFHEEFMNNVLKLEPNSTTTSPSLPSYGR